MTSNPNFDEQVQLAANMQITEGYEPDAQQSELPPFINNDGSFDPDYAEHYYV